MANLHVFMGLHGSSRRERAVSFAEEHQLLLISADDVRQELQQEDPAIANNLVFEEVYRRIKKQLQKGEDLVYEGTNLIAKQRKDMIRQMKPHAVFGYFIAESAETCIENDQQLEYPLGETQLIIRVLTAEVPFQEEGFANLTYIAEEPILKKYELFKQLINGKDETLLWTLHMVESGKYLLEKCESPQIKRIGYNNASAYHAFMVLSTLGYPISFIKDVLTLILYRKRYIGMDEKSREKLQTQLNEELYKKLLALV